MRKRFQTLTLILFILQTSFGATLAGARRVTEASLSQSSSQSSASSYALLESRARRRALWPGARWTEGARRLAVERGLRFIYRTALEPKNFAQYGSDYLWCFYTLSEAFSDTEASQMARRMGLERAHAWRLTHRSLPSGAGPDVIADYAFGSDAADSLGLKDNQLREEIRRAAASYDARAFLLFDPKTEPPPEDVPDECDFCHANNPRGTSVCGICKRPLRMRTRQDVWYDALITAYSGEHYGVQLGASYSDVFKWLPTLRPYRNKQSARGEEFYDTVYALTHVVYTLNDYSQYQLNPRWLPQEFQFLKENMQTAIKESDADMLGEFMDTLRAFGLKTPDPLMREGMEYLLAHQNRDGSWGNIRERDIYLRYHPTWNAVAALSEYRWRGENLSHPELKPLLEEWAASKP